MSPISRIPLTSQSPDEKKCQVMVYTATALLWGDVVVKPIIRVSTWLRSSAAPDWLTLYNAKLLLVSQGANAIPANFAELNLAVPEIYAFHLAPPARDPIDFDPTEINRQMVPVNAIFSSFIAKGSLRISSNATLKKYVELTREAYTGIYDVEVSSLTLAAFKPIIIPYLLVRQSTTIFTTR